jgi:hypothetical protein
MAKAIHLKNKKGQSFTVTKSGFEIIKSDPKWRTNYDFVGEVDEEDFAGQSESAQKVVAPKVEAKTEKVIKGDLEESTRDVFSEDKKAIAMKKEDDEKQANKILQTAAGFIDKRKYDAAKKEIAKALTLSPDNEQAKNLLAEIEAATKKK